MEITKSQRRAAIVATGMTQEYLAKMSGVSVPTLGKWIQNGNVTKKTDLAIIATIRSLGWVITESGIEYVGK